jgi:hypothetical protein
MICILKPYNIMYLYTQYTHYNQDCSVHCHPSNFVLIIRMNCICLNSVVVMARKPIENESHVKKSVYLFYIIMFIKKS